MSCEATPDDFGTEPISTEFELESITLSDHYQYFILLPSSGQGIGVPIEPERKGEDITISIKPGEGLLTRNNGNTVLRLQFEDSVPISYELNSSLFASAGYKFQSFSMELEITPSKSGGLGLQQHHCVTDDAVLVVRKRRMYPPGPDEILSLPIDATIDSLVESVNDDGEPVFEGRLHLFTFYQPNPWEDLFVYDLQANIRIE